MKSRKQQLLELSDVELNKEVTIAGTDYDRRRKVTHKMNTQMNKMVSKGKSLDEIAEVFGVARNTVKYNTDPAYRAETIMKNSGVNGSCNVTPAERGAYKRTLVEAGKKFVQWA